MLGWESKSTMSPSPRGFDAYCRKAEQGGTVERVCVALDVGLEMHDAFDARRPDGPTRLAVVLPAASMNCRAFVVLVVSPEERDAC